MLENLQFVDFNDIYVIAVGVSMAYIVVEAKVGNASFFSILSNITTWVKDKLLKGKKRIKEEEEGITTQIDYYVESSLLNDVTKGSLLNTYERAKKEVKKISDLEAWVERKLSFHTKTDYLNVISCDSFLFGLFILFAGVFPNKCGICIDGLVQIVICTICLLLIHCLWFERLEPSCWNEYIKPSIPLHCVLLCIAVYIGIRFYNVPIIPCLNRPWLSIMAVFTCFLGFISYLIANLLSNLILSLFIVFKALSIGISKQKAREHREEIEKHRVELDKIDKLLKESKLSLTITGNTESVNSNGSEELSTNLKKRPKRKNRLNLKTFINRLTNRRR